MKHFKRILASLLALLLLCGLVPAASAEDAYEVTDGDCTYRIENGEATLTGITISEGTWLLTVESYVDGYPVTKIASNLVPEGQEYRVNSLVVPETVRTIEPHAFDRCRIMYSLFFSEGLEEIGEHAFADCDSYLMAVTFPKSLTSIGKDAFSDELAQYSLLRFYAYADSEAYRYVQSIGVSPIAREQADGSVLGIYANLCYTRYPDGTVKLTKNDGGVYYDSVIPTFIEGCPVTAIDKFALQYDQISDDFVILPMYIRSLDNIFLSNQNDEFLNDFFVFYFPNEFTTRYFAETPIFAAYDIFLILERPFTDVADDDWYFDAASFAYYFGLFNGTSETEFSPKAQMTRAMLVTVLYRLDGGTAEGSNPFSDVPANKYYTDAVIWASENGIVNGVGNGRFDPDGKITREQIATILYRYTERLTKPSSGAPLSGFPDVGNVSDYAKSAMQWAVGEKLIGGRNAGGVAYLSPKDGATRAEVAQILMRYIIGP